MFPMLIEGVSMGTFQYEGSSTTHYYVENADGEEFEISRRLMNALQQADGTRPLCLPDNGHQILPKLKKYGLVRTSRFVHDDGFFNRFILFPIRKRTEVSPIFKIVNAVLPAVSILIFAVSVLLMVLKGESCGDDLNWGLYYGLIVLSVAFHEMGHLVAGLAYGYKFSDTGILLFGILPLGGYVAHEEKKDATRAERIQFGLAGVEVNLLMAGIFLLIGMQSGQWSLTLIAVANVNVAISGLNLLPTLGLDGESVLCAVCGINEGNIEEAKKRWSVDKEYRRKLLHSGLAGFICSCMFSIEFISKVAYWVFIICDIVCIVVNIFWPCI